MAQTLPRFCPRCGTPTVAGQHFCANCGLVMIAAPAETELAPRSAYPQYSTQSTESETQALPPTWGSSLPPSSPSRPPQKRTFGRVGCVLVFLLLLIVSGAGSYLAAGLLGFQLPGFGGGGSVTQPPVTTTQVNSSITYAGVDLTILSAQQSQSFVDDPNTTTTGMVRLHIQEQNKTSRQVSWLYYDIARLILLGNKSVSPTFVKAKVGIAPGATQTSIVDFAVPTGDKIDHLTLRLGGANEVQMDIPLTGHADLSEYGPRTVNLTGQMLYQGLNWTLVSATSQLSIDGQQASKGMVYIILTLKVDNTLSQQAIPGSAYDYARLKSGSTTASPKNTTLPVSFDAGATGQTGTVTFLMPQGSTAFTLIFLPVGGAAQATTDFQFA